MKKMLCVLGILSGFVTAVTGQNRFDIVIDEIMADPSPPVGLPGNEWVELKNTSGHSINLQGWRLGDGTGISGAFPSYILKADSFLIVCSSGSLTAMQAFGPALSVTSFPSLDNDGETIFLRSPNGTTVHAVGYSSRWYRNEVKKEGGWSLEMIDTHDPCSGAANWMASKDSRGGSPGRINSVDTINSDMAPPSLGKIYTPDSLHILLRFDDPVDSAAAVSLSHFQLNGGISIGSVTAIPPLFNELKLNLASPLLPLKLYELKILGIKDCAGNSIRDTLVKTGLSSDPLPGEWIINEILFDPKAGGSDYVEFYNNSEKIFDAARLFLANRTNGVVGSIKPLSAEPFFILPGEYLVVTADSAAIIEQYKLTNKKAIIELSGLPSFPDDEGIVVALKFQGIIQEEFSYKANWQFALIRDKEGVALERIDPAGSAQDQKNWHSASSASGYGTPGTVNSQ